MKRLVLPGMLLVAAAVGYVRFTSALNEPPPAPATYPELVKATQPAVPLRDGGAGLVCAAVFTAPPRPEAANDAGEEQLSIGELADQLRARHAVLDRLPFDAMVKEAKPGELDYAIYRRLSTRSKLGEAQRDLVLHFDLEEQLNNGGFHQFFFSATGDRASETRAAVARIGPPDLLSLYDCALTAFPDAGPSTDRDARNAQLATWGSGQFELFEPLDFAFSRRLDQLSPAREAYVRAHLAEMK